MIYVETSVGLAQLLAEDRRPPEALWTATPISSRLTEYQVWTRVHAHALGVSHGESVRILLARFGWLEMTPAVLARALEPWPVSLRTLDPLHPGALAFVCSQRPDSTG